MPSKLHAHLQTTVQSSGLFHAIPKHLSTSSQDIFHTIISKQPLIEYDIPQTSFQLSTTSLHKSCVPILGIS